MTPLDWPEQLGALENFLKAKGLACLRRGTVPRYGEKLVQYGNHKIAVRVWSEKGIWFADVADIAGRPNEWYDSAIIRDLFRGRGEDVLPVTEQMRIIEENWSAVADAFTPEHREQTHHQLDAMRKERAKRRFPNVPCLLGGFRD